MTKLFIKPKLVFSLRTNKGLSINELAAKAQIDRATITRIENGKINKPTGKVLKRIADALNVTTALLMTEDKDKRWL